MIKTLETNIKRILSNAVETNFFAGANVLVYKDGKEYLYAEAGMADIENHIPIRRDTIFRLYSMTKPITGAAVLKLVENGQLDLLEPVSQFLPGFKDQTVFTDNGRVPVNCDVTVFDLLGMTSGLSYPDDVTAAGLEASKAFFEGADDNTIEFANRLGRCGLAFQPGTKWRYGTSSDIAGAVIEIVSGKKFGEFLQDEIFAPLGMKDTGFYITPEKSSRRAKTYMQDGEALSLYLGDHLLIQNSMSKPPAFESGGAGLCSTADDYMKFAQLLHNGGKYNGKQIFLPKTIDYFTKPQLTKQQYDSLHEGTGMFGYSYGKFMRHMTDAGAAATFCSKGEYGWDGWLGTYFCNDPATKTSIVFFMQKTDVGTTPVLRKIKNLLY